MAALSNYQWLQLALFWAGFNLISAFLMMRWTRRSGRRRVPWFFITLVFSAVPAAVVALCERFGWLLRRDTRRRRPDRDVPTRCPHCRRILDPLEASSGGPWTCSRCGLVIDEGRLT